MTHQYAYMRDATPLQGEQPDYEALDRAFCAAMVSAPEVRAPVAQVQAKLRAKVGDEVFSSWFASMKFEGIDGETVRLSVPTRFLKKWIQAHYYDRVLACWHDENAQLRRIELTVRTGLARPAVNGAKVLPMAKGGELPTPPLDLENLGEDLWLDILNAQVAAARAHYPNFDVPLDVRAHIAKSVTHNGRVIVEGVVNRLLAVVKLSGQPISMELAEREIRGIVCPQEPRKVTIDKIQRIVVRHFNISRTELLAKRRTLKIVRPRQIAMYLAKTLTPRSLPEIGWYFMGMDHTTVLNAVRKIQKLIDNDSDIAETVEMIRKKILEDVA